MNPNANFAQGIPGRCPGRGIGLIDFASEWPVVLDCIHLLSWLGALSEADAEAMRDWWREWLEWVWTSQNGRDERQARNNHGSNYDQHVLAVAAYVGNMTVAADVCSVVAHARLDVQIGANGTLPLEDSRTKSQGYHAYDTRALLALVGACHKNFGNESFRKLVHFPGDDANFLYEYKSAKTHAGLLDVVAWLLPYARDQQKWPFKQILPFDRSEYSTIYRMAALAPTDSTWHAHVREFETVCEQQPGYNTSRIALTFPLPVE
jgi:hypothetical protein